MTQQTSSSTSLRRTQEQKRAQAAWKAVEQVGRLAFAAEYASLARGAPADIQTNGLGQTLAFLRGKGYERGQPKANSAHARLLRDLTDWLREPLNLAPEPNLLEWIVNAADTSGYRRATGEALAYLAWLRRFAEADLGGDATAGAQL